MLGTLSVGFLLFVTDAVTMVNEARAPRHCVATISSARSDSTGWCLSARSVSQVYKVVQGAPYGELQLMVAARKQGRTSAVRAAIQNHRKTWVTEGHFAYMAEYGINAVRVPVGHWVMASTTWQVRGASSACIVRCCSVITVASARPAYLETLPTSQHGHRAGPR